MTQELRAAAIRHDGSCDVDALLAEVTEALNETVKENRGAIRDTLDNINAITGAARPEIEAILRNINVVTADIRGMLAKGQPGGPPGPAGTPQGTPPGEIRTTLERIDRAASSLESALGHADNIAARIDKGEGTIGKLTKDETLINEVEGVVEDVGELVGGIGRITPVVGLRTDYNFLANTIKSYVELRLQPSLDKYYAIELVNDPRGKTSIEQVTVDSTNPNDPPSYRETRVTTTNDFRFSFQFAKRLGPLTFRFGIKESTGGVGADIDLFKERLTVKLDVFDFRSNTWPRLRMLSTVQFYKNLFVMAGIDDVLNNRPPGDASLVGRDYYVGAQLMFNDEDLKALLAVGGSALGGAASSK